MFRSDRGAQTRSGRRGRKPRPDHVRGDDLAVGYGRSCDDHPVHVFAAEEPFEIVVERDTALGGLRLPPLPILVPDGSDFCPWMLFGL
jgi:hypothetical protein